MFLESIENAAESPFFDVISSSDKSVLEKLKNSIFFSSICH
jgi:hypothetical protein